MTENISKQINKLQEPDKDKRLNYYRWFQTFIVQNPAILSITWNLWPPRSPDLTTPDNICYRGLEVIFEVDIRLVIRYVPPEFDYPILEIERTDYLPQYCQSVSGKSGSVSAMASQSSTHDQLDWSGPILLAESVVLPPHTVKIVREPTSDQDGLPGIYVARSISQLGNFRTIVNDARGHSSLVDDHGSGYVRKVSMNGQKNCDRNKKSAFATGKLDDRPVLNKETIIPVNSQGQVRQINNCEHQLCESSTFDDNETAKKKQKAVNKRCDDSDKDWEPGTSVRRQNKDKETITSPYKLRDRGNQPRKYTFDSDEEIDDVQDDNGETNVANSELNNEPSHDQHARQRYSVLTDPRPTPRARRQAQRNEVAMNLDELNEEEVTTSDPDPKEQQAASNRGSAQLFVRH
ncbi:hypothetical protein ANN_06001 [Periplaneta americana]|uniref:Uncharacterized protein n=1 Tax=Periplaneta americana TaxID=6978 RepID=A0ABQ8TET1_PERAM|nr:hypothetical protein ANN_06001 [Periplaneta americana]